MSTHNICFHREIRKILCGYTLSVAMSKQNYNGQHTLYKPTKNIANSSPFPNEAITIPEKFSNMQHRKRTIISYARKRSSACRFI